MISILEQERRAAVQSYRQSMAMFEADERELEYNRGWNDAKQMLPSNVSRVVSFFAGAFVGALLLWLVA